MHAENQTDILKEESDTNLKIKKNTNKDSQPSKEDANENADSYKWIERLEYYSLN